jgi:two-component system cell cycle response regulator CpdR
MPHKTTLPVDRRSRVLLVEDDEAACKGMARLLQARGFEVVAVHNGEAALQALGAAPPPDILLTDMQLPDMDGREVARHARTLSPAPWVVLITGWDIESERDDTASWGINRVLRKPVDLRELVAALSR